MPTSTVYTSIIVSICIQLPSEDDQVSEASSAATFSLDPSGITKSFPSSLGSTSILRSDQQSHRDRSVGRTIPDRAHSRTQVSESC